MDVKLVRDIMTFKATEGRLIVGDQVFYTIEEPWMLNASRKSCIPKGVYKCKPHNWQDNKKFKYSRVWEVTNVPNRTAILIHLGNTVDDTMGCILVGMKRGKIGGKPAVLQSRLAMSRLRDIIGPREFTLTIEE